jgi:hypothetical protein
MISRLNQQDESASGPCPLCETTKSENLTLQIQLDLCRGIIAEQLELLKDLTAAADAANTYLNEFGFSDKDQTK